MIVPTASLFDDGGAAPIAASASWLTGTLLGTVAITLCVIAVAIVGLIMLTGRFAVRDGARVVLGIFILLGAPVIAGAFVVTAHSWAAGSPADLAIPRGPLPRDLPPSNYDPYAGASLRQD